VLEKNINIFIIKKKTGYFYLSSNFYIYIMKLKYLKCNLFIQKTFFIWEWDKWI